MRTKKKKLYSQRIERMNKYFTIVSIDDKKNSERTLYRWWHSVCVNLFIESGLKKVLSRPV